MSIGRKNIFIRYYVIEKRKFLKKIGIEITDEEFEKLIDKFSEKRLGTLELIHEIDDEFKQIIEDYYEQKDLIKSYIDKLEANKELKDLPLEYSGITLNSQDIDLMRIEDAETPEDLEESLDNASNRQPLLESFRLSDKQFLDAKRKSYELYQDTLEDKNEEIKDPSIKTKKKIQYLKDSGELTEEEQEKINVILTESSTTSDITEKVEEQFGKEKAHKMYEIIRDCTPIEKEGIKKTNPEATRNLLNETKENYNSITIDDEAKYSSVVLPDDSTDFRSLKKALDFSKKLDKKVRLNTLIFYMDCPKELYNMEKNPENKQIVKGKLTNYVDETTKFISSEGYSDTVRSIDVFNELPNRFPMDGEEKYKYRGDIDQVTDENGNVSDNINSGWSKHLDIEDLCDVASVARKNLPETDFTYNDDNLTDPDKLKVTKDIILQIQKYEQEHNIKLIDSIGTQMHVDNDITEEKIAFMLRELSQFGLPIEITEFDLAMTHDVEGMTEEEIEVLRQQKMNEIISCIGELREECNIRGVTIWSKTNSQNFRVTEDNKRLIAEGKEPIDTLHGGYFTELMEPKTKQFIKEKSNNDHEINQPSLDKNKNDLKEHSIPEKVQEQSDITDIESQQEISSMLYDSNEPQMTPTYNQEEEIEQPKVLKRVFNPNDDNSNKGYVETLSLYTSIIAISVIMIILMMILLF